VFTGSTANPYDSKLPTPKCPDEHWGPTTLLLNGYEGFFPKSKAVIKLTNQFHTYPRLKMNGTITPLPLCGQTLYHFSLINMSHATRVHKANTQIILTEE